MKDFRNNKINHIVTTNVLARGIIIIKGFDQRTVTLVINMGIPYNHLDKKTDFETYLHRIGRTGRMGDVGIALNIIGNLKFK